MQAKNIALWPQMRVQVEEAVHAENLLVTRLLLAKPCIAKLPNTLIKDC